MSRTCLRWITVARQLLLCFFDCVLFSWPLTSNQGTMRSLSHTSNAFPEQTGCIMPLLHKVSIWSYLMLFFLYHENRVITVSSHHKQKPQNNTFEEKSVLWFWRTMWVRSIFNFLHKFNIYFKMYHKNSKQTSWADVFCFVLMWTTNSLLINVPGVLLRNIILIVYSSLDFCIRCPLLDFSMTFNQQTWKANA